MSDLPRSTRTGRGELAGPARVPRQVRQVTVTVAQIGPGVLELSTAFGWRAQARNRHELAHLVASVLFTEAQVAAYSRFRGREYDLKVQPPDPPRDRRGRRPDTHDPRDWRLADDGRWIDPGKGRHWSPDSQMVQYVKRQLEALGLAPTPDRAEPPQSGTGLLGGRAT